MNVPGLGPRVRVAVIVLLAVACARARPPAIDVAALMAEFEHMAERPLWPNFAPDRIPVAIFDGNRTWLYHHPAPPPEFLPVADHPDVRVAEGRYPAITANTSATIGGFLAATVLSAAASSPREQAALLMHEAFHVYQRQRHPDWSANEADLFLYPVDQAEILASRRLETEALRRALEASADQSRCWARTALDMRAERFHNLPVSAVEYERRTELNEGLAQYIQDRAAGQTRPNLLPAAGFAPEQVRARGYASGEALALLLDRFNPPPEASRRDSRRFFGDWREDLDSGRGSFLDQILERRLAGGQACEFYAPEKREALQRAQQDIGRLRQQRQQALRDFYAQPGWRVVIEAHGTKFAVQGFDPLNVTMVGGGLVLNYRYLKVGGDGASFELMGGRALTEPAGTHPLFSGIRRITVNGLTAPPQITEKDGGVLVSAPGLHATFSKASVESDRAAKQVTIAF